MTNDHHYSTIDRDDWIKSHPERFRKNTRRFEIGGKYFYWTFITALIFNAVGYVVASVTQSALFLDTIGTAIMAIAFGPFYGALAGVTSSLLGGLVASTNEFPDGFGYYANFGAIHSIVAVVFGVLPRLTIFQKGHSTNNYNELTQKFTYKQNLFELFDPAASNRMLMLRLAMLGAIAALVSTVYVVIANVVMMQSGGDPFPDLSKAPSQYCPKFSIDDVTPLNRIAIAEADVKDVDRIFKFTVMIPAQLNSSYHDDAICQGLSEDVVLHYAFIISTFLYNLPDKVISSIIAYFFITSSLPHFRYCFGESGKNYCMKSGIKANIIPAVSVLLLGLLVYCIYESDKDSNNTVSILVFAATISPFVISFGYLLLQLFPFADVRLFKDEEDSKAHPDIIFKNTDDRAKDVFEDSLKIVVAVTGISLLYVYYVLQQDTTYNLVAARTGSPLLGNVLDNAVREEAAKSIRLTILTATILVIGSLRYVFVAISRDQNGLDTKF